MKNLKTRQICLFFIAILPVSKIFILPSTLATYSQNDLWISAILNFLLDFVCVLAILRACKNSKMSYFEFIESTFGKVFSKVILALYFCYFMIKAVIPLNEQKDYVEQTLYTLMPSKLYFLPFFAVAFYICTKKLRVLGRASDVLWIFTSLGVITLLFLSIANADLEALLPVGVVGLKNLLSGSYFSLNWFGDCVYLAFFMGEFDYKKWDGVKISISYLIASLLVVIFLAVFYSIFTSIAFRQRFALTEIPKYSAVINNIGRFDYVGIVLILLSSIFSLSLPLYFAVRTLNRVFSFKSRYVAPIIVTAIQLLIMVTFTQYYLTIEHTVMNYLGAFFILFGNVIPAIISLIKGGKSYEIHA